MTSQRGQRTTGLRSRSAAAHVLCAVGLCVLMAGWAGCSEKKHYKTLSFFFDGVPDPNAPQLREGEELVENPLTGTRVVVYIHQPFRENQCNACHTGVTEKFDSFSNVPQDVCLNCHQKTAHEYPRMHGPVAAQACNLCHLPHESTNRALLSSPSPALCTSCHMPELLKAIPEHIDKQRDCLECHHGHGGTERNLLRPEYLSLRSSTTRPVAPEAQ